MSDLLARFWCEVLGHVELERDEASLGGRVSPTSDRVVIGMDPHKRSATIEVMTCDETVLGTGRFGTGRDGYAAMVKYVKQWPNRVWAIEGCQGIGRHKQADKELKNWSPPPAPR